MRIFGILETTKARRREKFSLSHNINDHDWTLGCSSTLKGSLLSSDLRLFVEFDLLTVAVIRQTFIACIPKATCSHSLEFSSFANQKLAQKDHNDNRRWCDKYQSSLHQISTRTWEVILPGLTEAHRVRPNLKHPCSRQENMWNFAKSWTLDSGC